ncbi:uncharacterized protein B0I36DRAFT_379710 [Microdochium trichocladiopsis]|uniref:Galactose oxidase n=1 Tax=Microdochium trichocladiopsis TaxID=1682393 RepID=A0A9P8YIC2_9PEZI|nr:uncharacterized protein B0I36DRAFT_379710 [Microdochium trichocladiopsis]KAH7040820.1 hypothetical protein B0I36DRAFT_379710 [Microdochium trichocladiopsis]
MAEVVAGLWAAEEVVSTSVQAGAAGYAVAKPTMPVRASFEQFGAAIPETSRASLARSNHTLTALGNRAYIFGGQIGSGELAGNEIHILCFSPAENGVPEYQAVPALSSEETSPTPAARTKHSACAVGKNLVVYGGCDKAGNLVDDSSVLWEFDTQALKWRILKPEMHPERIPPSRSEGILLAHDNNLVLYGGRDKGGAPLRDVWYFNTFTKTWNALPSAPVATSSAATASDTLYLVAASDNLSSVMYSLPIELYSPEPPTWHSTSFPTNPLTPGPGPRTNAGFLPVSTGYGRNFLLYMFGNKLKRAEGTSDGPALEAGDAIWDDMWTFQVPSSEPEMKASTDLANAIKPAKIKDQIREKLGAHTGNLTWCKVEPRASSDQTASTNEPRPEPRTCFASCPIASTRTVVLWGGLSETGAALGDGWLVHLE